MSAAGSRSIVKRASARPAILTSSIERRASRSRSKGASATSSSPAALRSSSSARRVTCSRPASSSRSASEKPESGVPFAMRATSATRSRAAARVAGVPPIRSSPRPRRPRRRLLRFRGHFRDPDKRGASAMTPSAHFVGLHPEADDVVARGERSQLGVGDRHDAMLPNAPSRQSTVHSRRSQLSAISYQGCHCRRHCRALCVSNLCDHVLTVDCQLSTSSKSTLQ